jgi:hypothetical protein
MLAACCKRAAVAVLTLLLRSLEWRGHASTLAGYWQSRAQ